MDPTLEVNLQPVLLLKIKQVTVYLELQKNILR